MKTVILALLLSGLIIFSGCCGSTVSSAPEKSDPYAQFYGQEANISSTYSITLEKYSERESSDGTKTVTITFTASNTGTEQTNIEGALFVTDDKGRNYEANPFACSTLINPGLNKKIDCDFYDVPPDAKIVSLRLGDSIMEKGKYNKLFDLQ